MNENEVAAKPVAIALLGAGTVGTQVARLLVEDHDLLSARAGADLQLIGIAVRDIDAPRDPSIARELLTTDAESLIDRADIVIELIGGIEPPRTYVRRALEHGASVVTGNKALLATHGPELYELAAANDVDLYYEAAVAGAVPVVHGLRESLQGDRVHSVIGILNGTTNFILDEMSVKGSSFDQALSLAQELGYAEADPSADVDGFDAGAKIAILASLAFHTRVSLEEVDVQGIRAINTSNIRAAQAAGYELKLVARARQAENGLEVSVGPTLVHRSNPLAAINGSYNAVLIDTESAGRLGFYGQGAGGAPTASAVLSDVVAAAANKVRGGHAPQELVVGDQPVLNGDEITSAWAMKVLASDAVGVLAQISQKFAENGLSIASVMQRSLDVHEELEAGRKIGPGPGMLFGQGSNLVNLTIFTYPARRGDVAATARSLESLDGIRDVSQLLRVEA